MIEHDDGLSDSLAALALGALSPVEAKPLMEHLASCERCRRAYAEFRSTCDVVGYAAELEPGALDEVTSARMKSRVMREVRESLTTAPSAAASLATARAAAAGRRATAGRPWLAYAAAAAALVVAVLTSLDDVALRSHNDATAKRIAALETRIQAEHRAAIAERARSRELAANLSTIVRPGSRHLGVAGGEVIVSGGRIVIALRHGPPLSPGKVYQAWTLAKSAKNAKDVAPSITFTPSAGGVAVAELPESANNVAAVALTVEPAGGSQTPTSKPAFVRAL